MTGDDVNARWRMSTEQTSRNFLNVEFGGRQATRSRGRGWHPHLNWPYTAVAGAGHILQLGALPPRKARKEQSGRLLRSTFFRD
jgi:hypothetical protein